MACRVTIAMDRAYRERRCVKGGVILGHGAEQKCTTGASVFSDSVFPNWPAKMSPL